MQQRVISATFTLLLIGHFAGLGFWGWISHKSVFDVRTIPEEARNLTVRSGATLTDTLDEMNRRGIAPSSGLMRLAIRLLKPELIIKKGVYQLPQRSSPWQILLMLDRGDVALSRITLREGMDKWETAAYLGKTQWGNEAEFMAAIDDPSTISSVDPGAKDLEGYLFPETYFFPHDATPHEIIHALVQEFLNQTLVLRSQLHTTGLSIRQWVSLASLIEKETGRADERFTIAGVFSGRLSKGMLLQCDPTIIYALKDLGLYRGKIFRSQILVDHPYNTYVYPGLPPGPIASPGIEALQAAFNPAEHGYLYFVSRNDGSHYFSRNLKEHQRAVRQYQRRK